MTHIGDELLQAYDSFEAVIKNHLNTLHAWHEQLGQGRIDDDLGQLVATQGLDFQDAAEAFNKVVRNWIRQTGHFPDLAEDMLNYLKEHGFTAPYLKALHASYKVFPIERDIVPITTNKEKE